MAKLSTGAKIAIGVAATATAVAVGYGIYKAIEEEPKKKLKDSQDSEDSCEEGTVFGGLDQDGNAICVPIITDEGDTEPTFPIFTVSPAIVQTKTEPAGGWVFRWSEQKEKAFLRCSTELASSLKGWNDFRLCMAMEAFPELRNYKETEWPVWFKTQAYPQIRLDATTMVRASMAAQGFAPAESGDWWKIVLWLKFPVFSEGCYEAFAPHVEPMIHCIASSIWEDFDWPPEVGAPEWQNQAWAQLYAMTEEYIDVRESGSQ